jgi:hypothetical protein
VFQCRREISGSRGGFGPRATWAVARVVAHIHLYLVIFGPKKPSPVTHPLHLQPARMAAQPSVAAGVLMLLLARRPVAGAHYDEFDSRCAPSIGTNPPQQKKQMDGLENPSRKEVFVFGLSSTPDPIAEQGKNKPCKQKTIGSLPAKEEINPSSDGSALHAGTAPPARMTTTAASAAARSRKYDTGRFGRTRPGDGFWAVARGRGGASGAVAGSRTRRHDSRRR